MFYYVEGTVAFVEQSLCVIDCAGVGYACHTSQNTISQVKVGKPARLYTYLYVREDIFDLYGFADQEELSCFKMLIGVSGVGPESGTGYFVGRAAQQIGTLDHYGRGKTAHSGTGHR